MAVTKEMNAQQDRQKALENAMKQITKEFGAGSIMRLGEMGDKLDIEVIPTGSLALDIAVGVGGYPRGRVIETMGRSPPARRRWHCMRSQKRRRWAASPHSSMRSMHSTLSMRITSESIRKSF